MLDKVIRQLLERTQQRFQSAKALTELLRIADQGCRLKFKICDWRPGSKTVNSVCNRWHSGIVRNYPL